jgi:uncharacterized protein YlxW (UPF0749 family)
VDDACNGLTEEMLMSSADRFAAIITTLGFMLAAMTAVLGLIVRITARWTRVESELKVMTDKLAELVTDKRVDHYDLAARIDKLDNRVERHEQWHVEHSR